MILERARDRQRRRQPGTNAGTIRPRKRTLCLYRGDAAIEQTVSVTKVREDSFSEFDYAAFGQVVDRLLTPVAVVAPDSTLLYANAVAASLVDSDVSHVIGQKMLSFVHPDDRERVTLTSHDQHVVHERTNSPCAMTCRTVQSALSDAS